MAKRLKTTPGQRSLLNVGYKVRFYKGQLFSYQHRRRIAAATAKAYRFESSNGNIHEGRDIEAFALAHALSPSMMRLVATGNCYSHRGWTLPGKPIAPRLKAFELLAPDGEIVKGYGVRPFAIAIGVTPGHLSNVVNGIRPQCKGWRLATPENIKSLNRLMPLATNQHPDPIASERFSFDKINEIRLLRASGYSYRQISVLAKVAYSSALKYGKNVIKGQL